MPRLRFTVLFKVMLMAVLAVGLTVSCSRRHRITEYDEIHLGATSVGTKALITDKPTLIDLSYTNHTGFGVYGYKTILSRNYDYRQFNNVMVYPDANSTSTTWSYSPKRYWDSDVEASYQFGAYWPYLDDEAPQNGGSWVSETGKVLTINDIPNWQEAASGTDYVVATRQGKYRDANPQITPAFQGGIVDFNFGHILANVLVRAYYVGVQTNHVNVLSMQLSGDNMLTTGGNADYALPFSGEGARGFVANSITTGQGSHALLPSTANPVTLDEATFCDESLQNPQYGYQDICSWFVVPSTGWQGLTLNVNYSLGDITQSYTPAAIAATPVTGIALNTTVDETTYSGTTLPQYRYVITLKFNSASNGIEIESVKVADWKLVNIETGVYNW